MSRDGYWILATCAHYLILISTVLDEKSTGFTAKMGKEKPAPKKLQLKLDDLYKMGIDRPEFLSKAKFD